jgi:two-component system NtrC family sensor kinase
MNQEPMNAGGSRRATPGQIAARILHAPDLQAKCGLFLEAICDISGSGRAVLTLINEDGREYQWIFTGYSDDAIGRYHAEQRTGNASAGETFGRTISLQGRNETPVGRLYLGDPSGAVSPDPARAERLDMLFLQMTHVLENDRLEQSLQEKVARLSRLEEQLAQAEKMSAIGQLVSGVAHELSNPLSGVIGFTQLLQASELTPRVRRHLDRIYGEAIRCQRIVQNLLTFTRRHKPEMTFRSIHDVIDSVLELRAYHLQVDDVVVERRYDPGMPMTMLDFHQMEQVFLNIVNNAHQAMMAIREVPRRLVITTENENGMVRVRLADSGPGIARERLQRIFEPFFTTKETGAGTGLGLSLSRAIVGNHQGTMSVDSVLGKGTTLTVELPLIEQRGEHLESPAPVEETTPRSRRALRLLVVDDEVVLIDLLADFLKHAGHQVDYARNGRRALELATSRDYDVILSDLKMPGLDGQGLFERLCAVKPEMKNRFVFSTGDLANPKVQAFFEESGSHYLVKPFKLESVLAVLEKVVGRQQAA